MEALHAKEKERNMQLRMKAGRAFMKALEEGCGQAGNLKTSMYKPGDDASLMRLMQKIDQAGGAGLEQRLLDAGNSNTKNVSQSQFNFMLKQLGIE